jgi:hypothetical protein
MFEALKMDLRQVVAVFKRVVLVFSGLGSGETHTDET